MTSEMSIAVVLYDAKAFAKLHGYIEDNGSEQQVPVVSQVIVFDDLPAASAWGEQVGLFEGRLGNYVMAPCTFNPEVATV
jgi:hypothetical protein